MSRLSIWCGTLLLAGTVTSGCHSGSPYYQRSFPNLIGYTYPNWCGAPLTTPPNGPPDEVAYPQLKRDTSRDHAVAADSPERESQLLEVPSSPTLEPIGF